MVVDITIPPFFLAIPGEFFHNEESEQRKRG